MSAPDPVVYRIDASDRLTAVNDGWSTFARANGGTLLLPPGIIGRSLWDALTDPTSRELYALLLARVRRGAGPVHFRFRCDSPEVRRLLDMEMTDGADGAVLFRVGTVATERRAAVPLLDPAALRSRELVCICGWCKRLPAPDGRWLEVEEAAARLDLFAESALPTLSHGICPSCFEAVTATIEGPTDAAGFPTLGPLPPAPPA